MNSWLFATASSILLLAQTVSAQTPTATTAVLKPIETLQCYKSVNATLTKVTDYTFATDGWCQKICGDANHAVMAITAGSTCYCGDTIPPLDQVVANSSCNTPCNGYNQLNCGGNGFWQVYLTGLSYGVPTAANTTDTTTSSSSSSTSSSATTTAIVTKPTQTVVVTAASSASSVPTPSPSANKVAIAVGVVVAFVGIAGIVGGLIFFLKQRKRKAIEEEHRRREAAAAVEKSEVSSITTDQRLDPSNIFSHRRESIGSIADEMDFSRRILQV